MASASVWVVVCSGGYSGLVVAAAVGQGSADVCG
jgi:hypothetical protein